MKKRRGIWGLIDVPFDLLGRFLDWANEKEGERREKACHGVTPPPKS